MKIFTAAQIKKWDAYTITHEPVASIDLMERAAMACYNWLFENNIAGRSIHIFCGKGNNGGDGLAITRLLIENNFKAVVYVIETGKPGSSDFDTNLLRLQKLKSNLNFIKTADDLPIIKAEEIIIDAIVGTGLNKRAEGIFELVIDKINQSAASAISIDLPSGLFADESSKNNTVVKATHTLTFQNYKLAFLLPENEKYCGNVHLLNIGLHDAFEKDETAAYEMTDEKIIKKIYKPRSTFSHKGNFGHAALLCGSIGMMGAAVLSAQACLRSGVGKLTAFVPKCGYDILQSSVPEAMCIIAGDDYLLSATGTEKFDAVGIGPGIGLQPTHKILLEEVFNNTSHPMVIDADALNIISQNPELLKLIPAGSILTPHPKEFERLFGKAENDFEIINLALVKSKELNVFIVLKGHFSFIAGPDGKSFFNNTGNAGMATAGSGDVLTGIITALLAQGYSALHACIFGVYLHGLAGDIATEKLSQEALIAGDIISSLGEAFNRIHTY